MKCLYGSDNLTYILPYFINCSRLQPYPLYLTYKYELKLKHSCIYIRRSSERAGPAGICLSEVGRSFLEVRPAGLP